MSRRDDPTKSLLEELLELQRVEEYSKEGVLNHLGDEAHTKISIGLRLYHMLPELIECIQRCINQQENGNEP